MVVSTVSLKIIPKKRKEYLQTMEMLLDQIRKHGGCRTYRYYQDSEDCNRLLLVGEWDNRKDLEKHLRSEHFRVLQGTLMLLQEPLDVNFFQSIRIKK